MANAVRKALTEANARVAKEKAVRDKATQDSRLNVNVSFGMTSAAYDALTKAAKADKQSIAETIRAAISSYIRGGD